MRLITWALVFFFANLRPEPPVTFCDLLRNPHRYNGQEVTVRATYRYGFEWSQLYCLDCPDKGMAWLAPIASDEDVERAFRRMPRAAGIVNLTVQGVFVSGGTYGHENGYRFQITPTRITDVKVILKGMKSPAEEEKLVKRWGCGGSEPK